MFGLFFSQKLEASNTQVYGNEVIYKTNPPVSDEEVAQAEAYDKEQEKKLQALIKAKAKANLGTNKGYACSCVLYAQELGLGISGYGAARNYPVTSQIPASTGFVVTYESKLGHIAKYTLQGDYLVLHEANWRRCAITSGRILPVGSPIIKGYL